MEDLQIGREVASSILSDPVASACGRLVLEEDFVLEQQLHYSLAHTSPWGLEEQRGEGRNTSGDNLPATSSNWQTKIVFFTL